MRFAALVLLIGCGAANPAVTFDPAWPEHPHDYRDATDTWTRSGTLRGQYQEVLDLTATIKSPEWRAAHADREAELRGLTGDQRAQFMTQAKAENEGPYEVELLVTTWDRREDDLDKGKRSVWHIALVDDAGHEVNDLEIVKDKRPRFTVRAEFPLFGDFATAYIARFPRTIPLFGPNVHSLRLRMSSERGAVELMWSSS